MTRGIFSTLYMELRGNPEKFSNYVRILVENFDILVGYVVDQIRKTDTYCRYSISPEERLLVTLRFLATGESLSSLHYQFRLGISTISGISRHTCRALWDCLQEEFIPQPTRDRWLDIAEKFNQICQFPNCLGAVDGKHIRIVKPAASGSEYYNYKKFFSIVLMAITDAQYKFIAVDIGAYGRSNDSQVFKMSTMRRQLYVNTLDIPSARPLPDTCDPPMPYVFVADEAFQLSEHLLKPYASRGLMPTQKIFNYRLSRARRMVECTFGILTTLKDMHLFARKIVLKKLHHKRDNSGLDSPAEKEVLQVLEDLLLEQSSVSTGVFPKSLLPRSTKFSPLSLCPAVEVFTRLVTDEFKQITVRRQGDNLTHKQRSALVELSNYNDIIIKPADKGGNIVIWAVDNYKKEAFRQLRDKDTYSRLSYNPLQQFSLELLKILEVECENGIIDKKNDGGALH
ncbi:uncharacterized protein ACNLHF_021105 [Anomaloglossus baeobatrachus]